MRISVFKFLSVAKPPKYEKDRRWARLGMQGTSSFKHTSTDAIRKKGDRRYQARDAYSGNADFFVQNGVFVPFSYRFRIVSFYAVSNAVWRKKRRWNGVFPFSQSQGTDKNVVYRFKRSSLSFILLTNQQPFQVKRF